MQSDGVVALFRAMTPTWAPSPRDQVEHQAAEALNALRDSAPRLSLEAFNIVTSVLGPKWKDKNALFINDLEHAAAVIYHWENIHAGMPSEREHRTLYELCERMRQGGFQRQQAHHRDRNQTISLQLFQANRNAYYNATKE